MPHQQTFDDLNINQDMIKAVYPLLNDGSYMVSKPVRAGVTTSLIIAAEKKHKTMLYLAPTNKIINETVADAAKMAGIEKLSIRIPANKECPQLQKEISKNKILQQLPLPLPDCSKCTNLKECRVKEIRYHPDAHLMSLTYAKLTSLMISQAEDAKSILGQIAKADIIVLDESHRLSMPELIQVEAWHHITVPDGYPTLTDAIHKWHGLCNKNNTSIFELLAESTGYAGKHLARQLINTVLISDLYQSKCWSELRDIAIKPGLMAEADILMLRDIISILHSDSLMLLYSSKAVTIMVSSGQSDQVTLLTQFFHEYAGNASIICVSGTNFETHPGDFSKLTGREVIPVAFPDIRKSNAIMTLIPDAYKLTSKNFEKKLPDIIEVIGKIAAIVKQPVLVFTMNKEMRRKVKAEIKEAEIKNVRVDYYRSGGSMGVEAVERVGIMIGMAETPVNSCDAVARGSTAEEMWLDSRAIRLQGVQADTWQAINRVKDPAGKVPSRVYCIGCRVEQLKELAKWGTGRHMELVNIKRMKGSRGEDIAAPEFTVKVDQSVDPVIIAGEGKNTNNVRQRSLKDYIAGIDYYKDETINSQKQDISSTNNSRENIRKLLIYNNPVDINEIRTTAESLHEMYSNRPDAYGEQYRNYGTANWTKVLGCLTVEKMMQHVQGKRTFGVYNLGLDDTVKWCCQDLDSHEGNEPVTDEMIANTQTDLKKVLALLEKYEVPYLLENSGSPGSYHVWIFLSKTATHNAYKFVRQIKAESGIKGKCECFPKQQALQNSRKYGNPVKIPICVNQKNGNRSVFIDPVTLEPLQGLIEHPGVVRLLEVPEPTKDEGLSMPKASKHQHQSGQDMGFDPCMYEVIRNKVPLEGSEGHEMRLAIAIKAGRMGLDIYSTVAIFADQSDFDPEISKEKVQETWRYGYKPYSCKTLQDKCSGLVKPYCGKCKRCPA